ncbi:hypothetical protein J4466_02365 [Candidatus Pacearchaeota archaeon]|nr:hypothetical protein [Candidatus Pacearchaeota archaeon]
MFTNKRGILAYVVIFVVIISLITLAMALVVYNNLFGDTSKIDYKICQQSVFYRNTFNIGPVEAGKNTIPLECKTEKICLENSDKSCEEEFGKANTDNKITLIKLSNDGEKAKEETFKTLSNAMYNCNKMLGEGQLNFLPTKEFKYNYCIICSRIVFDDKAKALFPEGIALLDLYNYMSINKPEGEEETYLQSIYKTKSPKEIIDPLMNTDFSNVKNEKNEVKSINVNSNDWMIDVNKAQIVIASMETNKGTAATKLIAGGAAAAVLAGTGLVVAPFTGGISLVWVGVTLVVGGSGAITTGTLTYVAAYPETGLVYYGPRIIPNEINEISGLKCQSFENLP